VVLLKGVIADPDVDVFKGDAEGPGPASPGDETVLELEVVDPQVESGGRGGRVRRSGMRARRGRRVGLFMLIVKWNEDGHGMDDADSLESQPASEDHGPGNIQENRVGREFPEDGSSSGDGSQSRPFEAQRKVEGVDLDLLGLEPQARRRLEPAGHLGEKEAVERAETDERKDRGRDEDERGRGDEDEARRAEAPFLFCLCHHPRVATADLIILVYRGQKVIRRADVLQRPIPG
jgi:hypothetical protein